MTFLLYNEFIKLNKSPLKEDKNMSGISSIIKGSVKIVQGVIEDDADQILEGTIKLGTGLVTVAVEAAIGESLGDDDDDDD